MAVATIKHAAVVIL